MNTYTETINRFRVVRVQKLPAEHKAEYDRRGIEYEIDDELGAVTRELVWSFIFEDDALKKCLELGREIEERGHKFHRYEVIDGGEAETVERTILF